MRGGWFSFESRFIKHIPIPKASEGIMAKINSRVTLMLENHKRNPAADTCSLEAEIDRLVYQLYDLKDEEIQIIENSIN